MENIAMQNRWVNGMSRGLSFLIGVDFLGLFVLNVGQIASRSILGMSSVSIPDISRFLFIWLVFLGTAAIYLRKGHLAITFLTERFSPRLRRGVRLATQLAMTGFLLILVRGSWRIMVIRMDIPYTGWDVAMGWAYLAVPVSAAVMLVFTAVDFVNTMRGEDPASRR
jgi:TRAP-type C4-dicarboxylate transport system permease small subunit